MLTLAHHEPCFGDSVSRGSPRVAEIVTHLSKAQNCVHMLLNKLSGSVPGLGSLSQGLVEINCHSVDG